MALQISHNTETSEKIRYASTPLESSIRTVACCRTTRARTGHVHPTVSSVSHSTVPSYRSPIIALPLLDVVRLEDVAHDARLREQNVRRQHLKRGY